MAADSSNWIAETETYCDPVQGLLTLSPQTATYHRDEMAPIALAEVSEIPDAERITVEADGQPCYHYRTNPTNLPGISIALFPQEMAFGFLSDFSLWELTGQTEQNGSVCYEISGTTSESYGEKLNVTSFTFLVDAQTGVLLQYLGYNADGTLQDYLYTESVQFESAAESVPLCTNDLLTGYTEVKSVE